jgi:hypothetical protein
MKINHRYVGNIKRICAIEASRYMLADPWLDVGRKSLVATDGYMLVCFPVEVEEGEISGSVPWHALKHHIRDHKQITSISTLICSEKAVLILSDKTEITYSRHFEKFPKWPSVIPKRKGRPTITLDARLLANLQMSMDATAVDLWIGAPDEAILVGASHDDEPLAIQMPCRSDRLSVPKMPLVPAPSEVIG